MEIDVKVGHIDQERADAIVVNLFEGVTEPGGAPRAVDVALGGMLTQVIQQGDFQGKLNQVAVVYPPPLQPAAAPPGTGSPGVVFYPATIPAARVLIVGLGKREEFTLDRARQVAATAARKARELGARHVATVLHGGGQMGWSAQDAAQVLAEGTLLGTYRYLAYKAATDDEEREALARQLERVTVVELDAQKVPAIEEGVRTGRVIADSVAYTRDLVNGPGNDVTPSRLAQAAERLAAEFRGAGLRCEVLEPKQMEELGMGALLGVARGSQEPARFIILTYEPAGAADPPLTFVGKGITFDSGGISIKPSEGMQEMKSDMAGGAAVLGALRALAALAIPIRVVGLVPATENLPSGTALKPGDVLRAMSGRTIEVVNTDAEGRLVLADAVAYAKRYDPAALIDLATLTGACITALGHGAAGLMGNDPALVEEIKAAAEAAGERAWELPLWEDAYGKQIKSDIADVKNTGGRPAGAITGALFIKRFVQGFPWAHLDIAGMAWAEEEQPYQPKGATGYGVRLLVELARRRAGGAKGS